MPTEVVRPTSIEIQSTSCSIGWTCFGVMTDVI